MLIIRSILFVLPTLYMAIIWLQSSHFNPESVFALSSHVSISIILLIGAALELAHFFEFGFLYFLLILLFLTFGKLDSKKEIIAAFIAIVYGLIDEIHQHFVPFRSFSLFDLFKDCIGVWIIWYVVHKNYYKNSRLGTGLRIITNLYKKDKKDVPYD
ncbi:VanZ family protein [Pseudomonas sp. ISL-84]|nr:VanZ family protein [Pseudomonas sp. ISL-84]